MKKLVCLSLCVLALGACEDGSDLVSPAPPGAVNERIVVAGSRTRGMFDSPPPNQVITGATASREGLLETDGPAEAPGEARVLLAYRYSMALELPREGVAQTQGEHMEACLSAGLQVCQVVNASVTNANTGLPNAYLSIRAEPNWLAGFRAELEAEAEAAGGALVSSSTQVDDLTARIVDSQARLAARTTLRDRLQELLETRDGNLADLLSVERELANVQSELDSQASVLAALRERVNTSILDLSYTSKREIVEPTAFNPIANALNRMGDTFARSVGAIILFVAGVLPWLVIILPVLWLVVRTLVRAVRGRRRAKARVEAETIPEAQA